MASNNYLFHKIIDNKDKIEYVWVRDINSKKNKKRGMNVGKMPDILDMKFETQVYTYTHDITCISIL